ncbi:MAG: shikimate kinase [Firmicutes bacterium]|nr:shikimate kinase [Bacillota bacterium]
MNNIILIGFMAVGKTTIGKSLKDILGYSLFDIDKLIEKEEKMQIFEIFKIKGEEYFRNVEKEISLRLFSRNNNIISAGGGLFLNEEIRKVALENNFVVFLDLDIKEVYKRINRNNLRPLAKGKSIIELKELYEKRVPFYLEANIRIITDNKTPKQIAEEIKENYYKWLNKEL